MAEPETVVDRYADHALLELAALIQQATLVMRRLQNVREINVTAVHGLVDKAAVIAECVAALEALRDIKDRQ